MDIVLILIILSIMILMFVFYGMTNKIKRNENKLLETEIKMRHLQEQIMHGVLIEHQPVQVNNVEKPSEYNKIENTECCEYQNGECDVNQNEDDHYNECVENNECETHVDNNPMKMFGSIVENLFKQPMFNNHPTSDSSSSEESSSSSELSLNKKQCVFQKQLYEMETETETESESKVKSVSKSSVETETETESKVKSVSKSSAETETEENS